MKKYLSIMTTATKKKCIAVMVMAIASSVLASIWPVKLGELYAAVSSGELSSVAQGAMPILVFGLAYLSAECISIIRRILLDCTVSDQEADIREKGIEKLLKMPGSYYSECLSGEITAQLNHGIAGYSQLIKVFCNDVLSTVFMAFCTLAQVVTHAPILVAGIIAVYIAITLIISVFQIKSQNGTRESIIQQKNCLDGQLCQSLSNLELIRNMNAEQYERFRLHPGIRNVCDKEKRHQCFMGSFDSIKQISKIGFLVAIFIVSVLLLSYGKMTASSVVSVCILFQQLVKPIDDVYRFMDDTASSLVKAKSIVDVMGAAEDPIFAVNTNNHKPQSSEIVLNDVIICNPQKSMELAKYENLSIPTNSIVAICGNSGCGKTTLVRACTRFYPFISGSISLLGHNINEYSQEELTNIVYYMPQKPFFFAGTIKENLIYGVKRHVSDHELICALKRACLFDTIQEKVKLNSNTETKDVLSYEIGENGSGLSGAECQRLAFARAFLRNPKLYIFDESTANLDANTTDVILHNIEEHAKKECSGIVYISHDPHVIARCKIVIQVDNKICPQNKVA